jgi:hypothetical protein
MITLTLSVIGIVLLVWHKRVGDFIFDRQSAQFRKVSGQLINWDLPIYRRIYRALVIFAALSCFIGALGAWFGPLDFTCNGHLCPRPTGYPLQF